MAKNEKQSRTDRIEWILAAISSVVVLAVFGFLAVEALMQRDEPATLNLTADSQRSVAGQTYIDVTVENRGDEAAADVEIEGRHEGDAETAGQVVLDYAPRHSRETVTLVLPGEVSADQVDLRVLGFRQP